MSRDIFETLNSKSGNLKKSSDYVNVQKLKQNNFIKVLFPLFKTKTSEFEFQSKKNKVTTRKVSLKIWFCGSKLYKMKLMLKFIYSEKAKFLQKTPFIYDITKYFQKLRGIFLWSSRKNSILKIFVKLKKLSQQLKFVAKTRLCVVSLHYYAFKERFYISKLKKLSRHELKFVAKTRLCIFKLVRTMPSKARPSALRSCWLHKETSPKSLYISIFMKQFEIWAGFGPVGSTENFFHLPVSILLLRLFLTRIFMGKTNAQLEFLCIVAST